MTTKDWKKSSKYNKKVYTIYRNVLPKYKSFDDNYYVIIGFEGRDLNGIPFVDIVKDGYTKSKTFNNYDDAFKFAKKYMRSH